jgi:hypothetical protein
VTTLKRLALAPFAYTLSCKDTSGNLVTPISTPTAAMFTDMARTAGVINLTVAATGQPQVFTISGTGPAVSVRYLKHLISTVGGTTADSDDDISFEAVLGDISTGLCTLSEVKLQLNKTSTADDVEIQSFIDAVTDSVENFCGAIVPRATTEWHTPTSSVLIVRQERLVSVTSIVGYMGTTPYTYVEATTPALASDYSFLVSPALNGIVTRLGADGNTRPFEGRILITYVRGMVPVPASINLAARMIVQSYWDTQRAARPLPTQGPTDLVSVPGFDGPIPARALSLLARYQHGSGLA